MEQGYLAIGNDIRTFLICSIPIILVICQAVVFFRFSWKESKALIADDVRKKVVTNSALFSIIPSLPIVISIAIMIPILGSYIPWLRLSVIGSVMYESAAADAALVSYGLTGLGDPGITAAHFIGVVWIMTLGMLSGPILNVLILKPYDKKLKAMALKGGFAQVAIGSLFTGIILFLAVPRALNFKAPLSIIAFFASGIMVLLCGKLAKITKIKLINEFSFPISMLCGMLFAIIFSNILV